VHASIKDYRLENECLSNFRSRKQKAEFFHAYYLKELSASFPRLFKSLEEVEEFRRVEIETSKVNVWGDIVMLVSEALSQYFNRNLQLKIFTNDDIEKKKETMQRNDGVKQKPNGSKSEKGDDQPASKKQKVFGDTITKKSDDSNSDSDSDSDSDSYQAGHKKKESIFNIRDELADLDADDRKKLQSKPEPDQWEVGTIVNLVQKQVLGCSPSNNDSRLNIIIIGIDSALNCTALVLTIFALNKNFQISVTIVDKSQEKINEFTKRLGEETQNQLSINCIKKDILNECGIFEGCLRSFSLMFVMSSGKSIIYCYLCANLSPIFILSNIYIFVGLHELFYSKVASIVCHFKITKVVGYALGVQAISSVLKGNTVKNVETGEDIQSNERPDSSSSESSSSYAASKTLNYFDL
jgi:hypothetical protein